MEDVFGPLLKGKVQGHQGKTAFFGPFSGLCAVYVWQNIY